MNSIHSSKVKQTGLGLISAIFVISVLALIAAGMASMVASSAKNHTQQLLQVRAQSAALSALDIELVRMAESPSCLSASSSIKFNTAGLYECSAEVNCSSVKIENKHFLHVTSEGTCGSGAEMAVKFEQKRILK